MTRAEPNNSRKNFGDCPRMMTNHLTMTATSNGINLKPKNYIDYDRFSFLKKTLLENIVSAVDDAVRHVVL